MPLLQTRTNLAVEIAQQTIEGLTDLLATYLDTAGLFKHAHWNVKGEEFIALHKLFDEQAVVFQDLADVIGERITALGGIAYGTAQSVVDFSILNGAEPDAIYSCTAYIHFLADQLSIIDAYLLEEIDKLDERRDKVTSNILQDQLHTVDKQLYFLEAHIQLNIVR